MAHVAVSCWSWVGLRRSPQQLSSTMSNSKPKVWVQNQSRHKHNEKDGGAQREGSR